MTDKNKVDQTPKHTNTHDAPKQGNTENTDKKSTVASVDEIQENPVEHVRPHSSDDIKGDSDLINTGPVTSY
ncbi:MAG: hypothetical protein ABIO24_06045 [Saprospiraceae bacterium]